MKYIIENDIDDIVAIYPDVFLVPFPLEHYRKKQSTGYNVLPVKFIDDNTLVGFCLVIEKKIRVHFTLLDWWCFARISQQRCF